jgi:MFS superfamily sulfate permease-like transporter
MNVGRLFESFRGYRRSWLAGDALAGLMLAALALPSQLATARLAGMPAETGLIAFAAATLAFAALGGNRFMAGGADSTIAPIFAGTLAALALGDSAHYAKFAGTLALMVGLILVVAGLLRAGWMADLLSLPVVVGFLGGIAVHIVVGQLPGLLGVPATKGNVLDQLADALGRVSEANPYTLIIGSAVLLVTIGGHWLGARVPGALIGLAAAALAAWQLDLGKHGVETLGSLSLGVPALSLPMVEANDVLRLLPLSVTVALVCMMQTAAVARSYPSHRDRPDDVSRDFTGVGAGNLLAGVTGAFPVDASPPNTAVVAEAGGRSQAAALIAVAAVLLLATFAGAAGTYVPTAALDAVLVYIAIRIFRLGDMIRIARKADGEILLVAVSAALVVLLPIERGVGLAILLSLLHSVYLMARPVSTSLVRLPGTTIWWPPARGLAGETVAGVVVFAPAAPLTFVNADYVRQRLEQALAEREDVRLLVIEASGVALIDYTASQTFIQTISRLRGRNIDVALARLEAKRGVATAARAGLLAAFGEDRIFHSVEEAVQALAPGHSDHNAT